ncbi:hypothetical protein SEA_HENOCCUS_52 [Streptomyces phage Henoccus]|nr:hypothetical protein SEA_HENOCCUS_52 [Streptomyces phage Henoccus]
MPRIRDVQRRVVVAEAPAPAAPARPVLETVPKHEHDPADHMVFLNADGTRSRICICVCDRCWPPGVGKFPGPCPDWNDEDV